MTVAPASDVTWMLTVGIMTEWLIVNNGFVPLAELDFSSTPEDRLPKPNPPTVSWTCKYCTKPQKSANLLPYIGEPKLYSAIIKEAAKSGNIMCWDCFHSLTGYLSRKRNS